MELIKSKPVNNSVRHQIKIKKSLLAKNTSFLTNKLQSPLSSSYGKSLPSGKISAWHRQRGAKKMYRPLVNSRLGLFVNLFLTYNPNQTSFNCVSFDIINKKFENLSAISHVSPGCLIQIKSKLPVYKLGYRMKLKNIPTGSLISNVTNVESNKVSYIKSAGTVGQVIQIGLQSSKVRLPSGKIIEISSDSFVTLGSIPNEKHNLIYKGKAGRNRNQGSRPIVRGIAMNPVDHPHGGRTNGGRPSVTPWGLPTKSKFYLKRRTRK